MRILIADRLPERCVSDLEDDGHHVTRSPELGPEQLAQALDHDALVVRSTRVTAETLRAADRLSLVVRAGSGTNTIATETAAERGVYVCNVPGKNAVAVAELALGLLIALDRRIPDNVADLRAGRWNKRTYQEARGLLGRSVGVVGLGDIGLAFAERVAALGMRVRAVERAERDPRTRERIAAVGIEMVEDLETLAATCEVVSFHVPLTADTDRLVDASLLRNLRPGAIILNTSRGEIVDEEALIAAMDEKGIRAGLDVFRDEPPAPEGGFTSPLAQHPNVYGTHHIGASTAQAQEAIAAEVVRIIRSFAAGGVRNCVNLERGALGTSTLLVRHLDQVGVLSGVLGVLKEADINVEQMENEIFAGQRAAAATIRVSGAVTAELRRRIEEIDEVIHLAVLDGDG